MPAPLACPHCRYPLPDPPPDGVCPGCGSRLTGDTPPGDTTHVVRQVEALLPGATVTAPPSVGDDRTLSAAHPAPPPALPHHAGLTFLGDGGMGEVFRAVHVKTDQVVAVKFVHRRYAGDPGPLARFDTEVKALARSRHPNVVAIYEVGESAGRPYFTMEYLGGGTLAARARRGPVDFREAARLVAAAAAGIAAAHGVGVLHRDVKPGNVLLADDGTPKVTDFGLAKLAGAATRMTISGDVIGTPAYMAPEQAAGRLSRIDERTDVYGLGAVLYELLTGRPPFKGADKSDTLRLVQTRPPEPPGRVRPGVPAGLEAVCLKCLEKDPALRYQSAKELADDLTRWLAGDETVGRPAGRLRRAWRAVVRNRLKVAGAVLVPLVLLAAVPFVRWPEPTPTPPPDPRAELEQELAAGRRVTLIGETGNPRWSEWHVGGIPLAEAGADVKPFGFQTNLTSALVLLRDPMVSSYRLSARFRHTLPTSPAAGVGLFVGMDAVPAGDGRSVTRWLGFEYSDWLGAAKRKNPKWQASHGLEVRDLLTVRLGGPEKTPYMPRGVAPFTPADNPPIPWRRLDVDVSPAGVAVYWDGSPTPAIVRTAAEIEGWVADLNRNFAAELGGFAVPPRPWDPRRPLGVYVRHSVVFISDVVVEPR